ncbi:family A G protein-coupled receptor-like protein [Suhomyces tanzawaensis NRRL Y-17324]|uniref:Family A G protein-coupled receptor-like protein n=1 Tax=Suhomyces tanzawaensis NRRL Y-17324 TaxID=984487 RepID=A0A1E4SHW1_9ASCO|nr:family A G protein-coupled receptor-like protein [Suhomyces tanzawaensis NRRL Y-17324]ODV79104.1 family A G protein-coupled receptor-like protein [Suhomyces tanzawaensis NRRL Y-17324]
MPFTGIVARNNVLEVNRPSPSIDIHLTNHGSDWLWAVFAIFAVLSIVNAFLYGLTNAKTNGLKKTLLIYPLFISSVMAFAYFSYASNLGYAGVPTEFNHVTTSRGLDVRQIFYAKYIGWFLSWPFVLTIFEISTHTLEYTNASSDFLTKAITLFQGLITKFLFTEVFVLGLLIGSLIESTYKWGFFTFSAISLLFTIFLIGTNISASSGLRRVTSVSHLLIIFQFVVWILYPINWGLSEGGNVIQPDSEAVFYGILDLITFAVIPTALTWINVASVDEEFFSKLTHFKLKQDSTDAEKSIGETPRHSGDTAVPANVNQTEANTEVTV